MNIEQSLEEVELALTEMEEKNEMVPIIVEGVKDQRALRNLGFTGKIITINKGLSIADFSDWIASKYDEVILLTDWDRRGGTLCRRMMDLLKGRVQYHCEYRQRLGKHAMIRKVEGLPSWIMTMTTRREEHAALKHQAALPKTDPITH